MKAQGAGGQHVNTTESAVRYTHLPTGIVVFVIICLIQCQNERSQHRNRAIGLEVLKAKLYARALLEKKAAQKEIYSQIGDVGWGSQIRSYVMSPYTLVKDSRTGFSSGNVEEVMAGGVQAFMQASLLQGTQSKNQVQRNSSDLEVFMPIKGRKVYYSRQLVQGRRKVLVNDNEMLVITIQVR